MSYAEIYWESGLALCTGTVGVFYSPADWANARRKRRKGLGNRKKTLREREHERNDRSIDRSIEHSVINR